jgi:ABC-2 type transport system permease protein
MPRRSASVVWRTIHVDWRLLAADRTLAIAIAVFALLLGYGVTRGSQWVQVREQQRVAVLAASARDVAAAKQQLLDIAAGRLSEEDAPFAGWVFTVQRPATLPTAPAAALSIGQADLYPFSTSIDLYTIKNALFKNYETESPGSLLAGRFDTAFVLVYFLPLVICAVSYNLLSQEREDGTLGLLLSQPVGLGSILLGKVIARLGVLLLVTVVVMVVVLAAAGGIRWRAAAPALGSALLLTLAYAAFWAAVGVRINTLGRSSTYNAIALFAVWLTLSVIVPAALTMVLVVMTPPPSRLVAIQMQRNLENQAASLGRSAMLEYRAERGELGPPGAPDWEDIQSRFIYTQIAQERRALPLVQEYQARLDEQQRLVDRLQFASPAVLFLESLNALAGTDRRRAREYTRQVEAFVDQWRLYSVPRSFRQQHMTPADFDSLPSFDFVEAPRTRAYAHATAATATLFLAALVIAMSAGRAIRSHRVTG